MQKIIELNKIEKNLVSGGDRDHGEIGFSYDLDGFNCTHSKLWPNNEGPCTETNRYACHTIITNTSTSTSNNQRGSWRYIVHYALHVILGTSEFAGVYVFTRMRMYNKARKTQ